MAKAMAAPTPSLPQYVATECPPPSYEEIMGQTTVGTAKTSPDKAGDVPPLSYVDIMPRCLHPGNIDARTVPKFDRFDVLVEAANYWLKSNPSFAVWKCETVDRKVDKGPQIVMENMSYMESTFGFNVYCRGLRLWLTKREMDRPIQELGFINVVPEQKTIDIYGDMFPGLYSNLLNDYRRLLLRGYGRAHMRQFMIHEGLKETLAKFNAFLKDNPIPGIILNAETCKIKTFEGFFQTSFDPAETCWYEYFQTYSFKRSTTIFRVFYVKGAPAKETLHMQTFYPEVTVAPDILKPTTFENLDLMMARGLSWISTQRGIRLLNISSDETSYYETHCEVQVSHDSTEDFDTMNYSKKKVRLMRIFYVTSPATMSNIPPPCISCRLFTPVRTAPYQFETMSQTMHRIGCWLRLTGLPIYSVETTTFAMRYSSPIGIEHKRSSTLVSSFSGERRITCIIVYFPQSFQEPPAELLPPSFPYDPRNEGASCSIL